MCQLNQARSKKEETVAGKLLNHYWRSVSPTDSKLREKKMKGRGADRKEKNPTLIWLFSMCYAQDKPG